jgi:hypothetical protein
MRVPRFGLPRGRRAWIVCASVVGLSLLFVSSSSANLTGSTFEGNDGNLVVNTAGDTDWANVAGLSTGVDLASGSGDNSFGQGTKEDGPAVSVVSGSIPPNKSDLTRFYEASESVGGQNFLYLGWERSNVLGSANMDFEINQATTPGLGTAGAHTINRTPGDLLVTYDFTNGGSNPVLGLLTWITSANGTKADCFSANALPCWGDHVSLNSGDSEGAINTGTVTDPLPPNAPRSIPAFEFGEAAINLTAAGVFPPGTCKAFGSTFLKSRSSASFTAEVKDFVAPVPVNISNCGEIKIIKNTDPRGISQNFGYTSTIAGADLNCSPDSSPAAFTLNDGASTTNSEDCKQVPVGNYTVTEGPEPATFSLESLTCTATTGSSGTQNATTPAEADIGLIADGVVTCTYVNQQHLGAIKITKTSTKGNAPLGGATFSITGPNSYSNSVTSGGDGTVCVDQLPFGDYSVKETAAPTGYKIDDTSTHTVTVNANSTCGDGNEATFSATDTPLSKIGVSFNSKAGLGVTTATIQCTGDSSAQSLSDSGSTLAPPGRVLDNLAPGTYTCTVVIDP